MMPAKDAIISVSLSHLHADPRSANRMSDERLTKLAENIAFTGQMQPLVVRPHPKKKDQSILIDGHYRKKALEKLGQPNAPCVVWADVDEAKSGLFLATFNRLRGEDHPRKRAELLQTLLDQFDKDRLCQLIPETQTELNDLLLLLTQQEDELKQLLEKQQADEAKTLPVLLNFVLSQAEAEMVKAVLTQFDAQDDNRALVQLCQTVQSEKVKHDQ